MENKWNIKWKKAPGNYVRNGFAEDRKGKTELKQVHLNTTRFDSNYLLKGSKLIFKAEM